MPVYLFPEPEKHPLCLPMETCTLGPEASLAPFPIIIAISLVHAHHA